MDISISINSGFQDEFRIILSPFENSIIPDEIRSLLGESIEIADNWEVNYSLACLINTLHKIKNIIHAPLPAKKKTKRCELSIWQIDNPTVRECFLSSHTRRLNRKSQGFRFMEPHTNTYLSRKETMWVPYTSSCIKTISIQAKQLQKAKMQMIRLSVQPE